jgi:putative addiction module component (TIGR02574 family)
MEDKKMLDNLQTLSLVEKILLVEDLWDSIAAEQATLSLTDEQKAELDRRLAAYESDGIKGRIASEVIAGIRQRL